MKRCHGQSGSGVVELALVIPVLVLLTVGSFEMGRAFWYRNTIGNAVRDAARWASLRSDKSDYPATAAQIVERVELLAETLDGDKLQVSTAWDPSNSRGATITIQATYEFVPILGKVMAVESITLRSSSESTITY